MPFSKKPSPINSAKNSYNFLSDRPVPEPTDQELRDIERAIKLSLQDHYATDVKKARESKASQSTPQKKQQSQPIYPWSAHIPPLGQWPSPFHRNSHVLSTTATAAGELFLFGGFLHSSSSASNDLYMISTRDFSATLLKTSGDVPDPRWGHRAAITSTTLLIWGGRVTSMTGIRRKKEYSNDESLYLLNLVSREWTRVVVKGPKPCGRYDHTVTLIGSKLFVFGGWNNDAKRLFNDIWAFDLNSLISNPRWESYETASGNERPLPRALHVSVTTGDRIIIFGGCSDGEHFFNDTWSFNISTRKWTELQCTGSFPSPRAQHAAVLVDNLMYVFGGRDPDGTRLGDLTALDLSTQRWIAFQGIGPGPCGRSGHAMASSSDGTRIFLLGGVLSPDAKANGSELIYVLDTKRIAYPDPDPNAVNPTENATQLARKSLAGPSTQGQPQQPRFSSSDSDVHAEHGTSPFQRATPGELYHPAPLQIARERNRGSNDLPSYVLGGDDDSKGPTGHRAKFVAPDASSEKEVARLEHECLIELERQLLEMRATQAEGDRHIAWLTDQLVQRSALLEQAGANAADAIRRAGLEQRELQAKLDELLLSRDQAFKQAQSALQTTSRAAEANERSQRELAEVHAKLEAREFELAVVRARLADAEDGWAESKAETDTLRAGTQAATGLVNMDVDRVVMSRLMERVRAVEAEMALLRGDEKGIEEMERRNVG